MKMMLLFLFGISTAHAKTLDCAIGMNGSEVHKTRVETSMQQKVGIGNSQEIRVYVTEKKANQFILESFIANYDARIYSEGFLKIQTDQLSLSLWGRDMLFKVTCKLAQ